MEALRPFQQAAIDKFFARPERRLILAHATSAGKTRTALEIGKLLKAKRILFVCSAMARGTMTREFAKWAPEYTPEPVRYGRARKSLTKAQSVQRDASYLADVRVCSYDLLTQMLEPDARGFDLIIIDEVHNLREPTSKQSKTAKKFLRAHKGTPVVALTATPIPNEVYNVWNLIDTLWPGLLGRAGKDGGVPWSFKMDYCHATENEYAAGGFSFSGYKSAEALEVLRETLHPYMHIVSDAEVAPYLPALDASPLYLDVRTHGGALAYEWLEPETEPVHQVCVFFTHDSAYEFAAQCMRHYPDAYVLTGLVEGTKRDAMVQEARSKDRSLIIATSESIRESIDLSFVRRVLIQEWRTTPAQAIQLMGRFRRSSGDKTRPPKIEYVVQPGDTRRAAVLMERIRAVQGLMGSSQGASTLSEIFSERPMTEERLEAMHERVFASARLDYAEWDDSDSDDW